MSYHCSHCTRTFKTALDRGKHNSQFRKGSCTTRWGRRVVARTDSVQSPGSDTHNLGEYEEQQGPAEPARDSSSRYDQQPEDIVEHAEQAPQPSFSSTFELFRVLNNWGNGEGSAAADQQELLNLLHNPDFDAKQVCSAYLCTYRVHENMQHILVHVRMYGHPY